MERPVRDIPMQLREEGEEEDGGMSATVEAQREGDIAAPLQLWNPRYRTAEEEFLSDEYDVEEPSEEEEEEEEQEQGRRTQLYSDDSDDNNEDYAILDHGSPTSAIVAAGSPHEPMGRLLQLLRRVSTSLRDGTTSDEDEDEEDGNTEQTRNYAQTAITTFTTTSSSIISAFKPISQAQRMKELIGQCAERLLKWRSRQDGDAEPLDILQEDGREDPEDEYVGMPAPTVAHLALTAPGAQGGANGIAPPIVAHTPPPPGPPRLPPWRNLLESYSKAKRYVDERARLATRLGGLHMLVSYGRYFMERVTDTATCSTAPPETKRKFLDGLVMVLQRLRSLSAHQQYKVVLFDSGAGRLAVELLRAVSSSVDPPNGSIPAFLYTVNNANPQSDRFTLEDLSIAMIQNLSEHRFHDGTRNPNQVKIFLEGAFDAMLPYLRHNRADPAPRSTAFAHTTTPVTPYSTSVLVEHKFLALMVIANLAMNEENLRVIYRSPARLRGLETLSAFPEYYRSLETMPETNRTSLYTCWVTLQPHIGLLASCDPHIQRFALFNLRQLYKGAFCSADLGYDAYLLYHALVAADGRNRLRRLALEADEDDIRTNALDMLLMLHTAAEPGDRPAQAPLFGRSAAGDCSTALQMLESGQFSDVTFVVDGDRRVRAHRVVLAARSPVFAAMFAAGAGRHGSGLRESRDGAEVVVRDVHYEAFVATLRWVYGCHGSQLITSETALELLHAAEMLALDELKSEIEYFLVDFVDVDTVFELSRTAVQYHCAVLKKACLGYLQRNWVELQAARPADISELDEGLLEEIEDYMQE